MSLVPAKDLEGVLLVDKPTGPTSHDVVHRVRRKLRMKRVGHAGTLDPMATGLMLVLVGRATKISQFLISLDKEYEGTIRLGVVTNSYDAEGEVMETHPVPDIPVDQIRARLESFIGDQYQTPPMFSAIKVGGVPLYRRARKGEEVVREPRFIRVSRFDLLGFESPDIRFRLNCSKGTYVRSLAHDLGRKLGCGAHLNELRRTATENFRVDDALTLEEIEEKTREEVAARLIPVVRAVPSPVVP